MNKKLATGGFFFPKVYTKNNKAILNALKNGDIDYAELTRWNFVDEFFCFLLEIKFFEHADITYPNPRRRNNVPIWFLLSAQLILKLYSGTYHQLKFLLNSGSILTRLGFNISNIQKDGFNKKNLSQRQTIADSDAIRRYFKDTKHDLLRKWYNTTIQIWFKSKRAFTKEGLFVLDQSRLVVPNNTNYEGSSLMPVDENGHFYTGYNQLSKEQKIKMPMHRCYGISTLLHATDKEDHFHIASYDLGPGNEKELVQARRIVFQFCEKNPGVMKELLVDRGYVDGEFITKLKNEYNVDTLIPLKSNMSNYIDAVVIAKKNNNWVLTEHVMQDNENLQKETFSILVEDVDLWPNCSVPLFLYVSHTKRWSNSRKKYDEYDWVLATTKKYKDEKTAVTRYGHRFQIEERFRQLKASWKINKFSSPARGLIESHICFTLLTYSLLQLYFRKKNLQHKSNKMLDTLRHQESSGMNSVVIYSKDNFGVIDLAHCLLIVAGLEDLPREKIRSLMQEQIDANRSK